VLYIDRRDAVVPNLPRLGAAALMGAIVLGAGSTADAAEAAVHPDSAPTNQAKVTASCDDGFSGAALIRRSLKDLAPRGQSFVVHVVGGTKKSNVLVPTKTEVTFTFTDASGNAKTTVENVTKNAQAGVQANCTLVGTNAVDGGTLDADGTVTGAFH